MRNLKVSISKLKYDQKPTSIEYSKMKFEEQDVTINELSELIKQGYSFCHVFWNNDRKNKNFKIASTINIDVDDYSMSMSDFLKTIQYKPSISYTTFSNNESVSNYRFRLVYVLDQPITDSTTYQNVYTGICNKIGLSNNKDNCGKVISQLMNGNSKPDI